MRRGGPENRSVVYQAKSGAIELRYNLEKDTLWASLSQIADLFDTDKSGISRHIRNIFVSEELEKQGTVANFATVQVEGDREVFRDIEYFNLDVILSVGYRVNSLKATKFRQWATKTLRAHILDGYTINRTRIVRNYDSFLEAVSHVKELIPSDGSVDADSVLELVKLFAGTWVSLDAYDKSAFPAMSVSRKRVNLTVEELTDALRELKHELIAKDEATDLFGLDLQKNAVAGIVGNVLQSFAGKDLYPSVEEKAAHLLYFMVKTHPFTDGNKRCGAFAFVWFLKKANRLDLERLTPEALTALTLLIAESDARDKSRMTGLVSMLLRG